MSCVYFSIYVEHAVHLLFNTKLYQTLPEKANVGKRRQPSKLICTEMPEQPLLFRFDFSPLGSITYMVSCGFFFLQQKWLVAI